MNQQTPKKSVDMQTALDYYGTDLDLPISSLTSLMDTSLLWTEMPKIIYSLPL